MGKGNWDLVRKKVVTSSDKPLLDIETLITSLSEIGILNICERVAVSLSLAMSSEQQLLGCHSESLLGGFKPKNKMIQAVNWEVDV